MNFTPLLASLKQEIGQFNPNEVTSMKFDMLPQGEGFGMYATVVLTNGKQFEGWTDAPTSASKAPKTTKPLKAEATTGLAQSTTTISQTTETDYPAGQSIK